MGLEPISAGPQQSKATHGRACTLAWAVAEARGSSSRHAVSCCAWLGVGVGVGVRVS